MRFSERTEVEEDSRAAGVVNGLLEDVPKASLTVSADLAAVSKYIYMGTRELMASTAVKLERYCWADLERSVAQGNQWRLVCYVEADAYDSADYRITTQDHVREHIEDGTERLEDATAVLPLGNGGADANANLDLAEHLDEIEHTVGVQKVLQLEGNNVFAIHAPQHGYCVVRGSRLTWLQVADRNTARCYKHMLEQQRISTVHADSFPRKVRVSSTDGDGALDLAERSMDEERGGWLLLRFLCCIHVLARCLGRLLDISKTLKSRLMLTVLSLGKTDIMGRLRRGARKAINQRLLIVQHVNVSAEAEAFKVAVMDAFIGSSPKLSWLRALLLRCCPGDWRDPTKFVVAAPPTWSRRQVLRWVFHNVVPALWGHCPFRCPTHRWTGIEETLRDIGLPAAIHNMGQWAYLSMMETYFTDELPPPPGPVAPPAPHEGPGPPPVVLAIEGPAPGAGAADDPPAAQDPEERDMAQRADHKGVASPEEAKANRKDALAFYESHPTVRLVLLGMLLAPLLTFMAKEFEMLSDDWQRRQDAKIIYNGPTHRLLGGMVWPLLVAAAGTLQNACMQGIAELNNTDRYRWIPKPSITLELRNWICRSISRQGAAVHQLVCCVRKAFPWMLFLLVTQPAVTAAQISATCPQLFDAYTKSYVDKYSQNLTASDGLIELALVIMTARTSTVLLECRNAHVSRWVRTMSLGAKDPLLRMVSNNFLLSKLSRRKTFEKSVYCKAKGVKPPAEKGSKRRVRKDNVAKGKRRGGGGAWRAFISERCKAVSKAVFSELAKEYRALPDEERARLRQDGAHAAAGYRHGGKSFGRVTRDVARATARSEALRRAVALASNELADRSISSCLAVPMADVADEVKKLKMDSWLLAKMKREQTKVEELDVHRWRSEQGIQLRDKAIAANPAFAPFAGSLCGAPQEIGNKVIVLDWFVPFSVQLPRLVTLLEKKMKDAQACFLTRWREMHTKVRHATLPAIAAPKPKTRQTPTYFEAGICLCGLKGTLMWRLYRWIDEALKHFCNTASEKALLDTGNIIIRFTHKEYDPHPVDFIGPLLPEPIDDGLTGMFVVIALMYWKPYRPTYREFLPLGIDADVGHLQLQGTNNYFTQWELCSHFQGILPEMRLWTLTCYSVHESTRPLHELDPRRLEVEAYHKAPVSRIFPRRPHGKGGQFTVRDRAMMDLDDVPDGSSSSSEDEADDPPPEQDPSVDDSAVENESDETSSGSSGSGTHRSKDESLHSVDVSVYHSPSDNSKSHRSSSSSSHRSSSSKRSHCSSSSLRPSEVSVGSSSKPSTHGPPSEVEEEDHPPMHVDVPMLSLGDGDPPRRIEGEVLQTPWGTLTFHQKNNDITATCTAQGHHVRGEPQCRIWRKSTEHPSKTPTPAQQGQGRPAARLICWLRTHAEDRWHHVHEAPPPTLASRELTRDWINDHAEAKHWCACFERPRRAGEPEEPPEIG